MDRVTRLLDGARDGRSGTVVLQGEAGIGKTALLDRIASGAGDLRLVRGVGIESETELAFSGLHLMLHPHIDRFGALPARQAAALRSAFGVGDGPAGDRFLIGAATLTLLSELAADRPLACLVDDAQWLDTASLDALLFAARRLGADRIAMVFAVRDGARPFPGHGLDVVRLAGLDRAAAEQLVTAHAPALTVPVRERLLDEAAGNPLALIELASALQSRPARHAGPLPVGGRVQETFRRRAGRDAGRRPPAAPRGRRRRHRRPRRRAARRGGARAHAGRPRSRRGGRARRPRRRGGAVPAPAHPRRHLPGRPPPPADRGARRPGRDARRRRARRPPRLAPGGRRHRPGRGRRGRAGAGRAPRRAPRRVGRRRRRLRARGAAQHRGREQGPPARPGGAGRLRRGPPRPGHPPRRRGRAPHRGRRDRRRGHLRPRPGRLRAHVAGRGRGTGAAGRGADRRERPRAGGIDADRGRLVRPGRRRARPGAAERRPAPPDRASGRVGEGAGRRGPDRLRAPGGGAAGAPGAVPAMRALFEASRDGLVEDVVDNIIGGFMGLLVAADRPATELLERLAAQARAEGALGLLPYILEPLAIGRLLLGDLRGADSAAQEGLSLAADIGMDIQVTALRCIAVRLEPDPERSRAMATDLRKHADVHPTNTALASWGLGLLDLAGGRAEAALERLDEVCSGPARYDVLIRAVPDHAEAAVRAGRPDLARTHLPAFEAWAAAASCTALLSRCRALLADGDAAEEHYRAALDLHGDHAYDAARTRLLYGEWLRRRRRRTEAGTELAAARDAFARLGAAGWAERARAELEVLGDRPAARAGDADPLKRLTPQELQVVRLAAAGLSNREIGAQLFLSPRTVGHHLYKAYPKIGVTRRVELARLVSDT
ncbi:LuxR C-terminal-related transcriptional regulator [Actinomadura madurae]|nr:LuxR C-terminal-related transcriptional regulator [Actinomadura madurae]